MLIFERLKTHFTEGALVVTTGSGTHDPEEKTPLPPPKHANVEWLAYLDADPKPDGFRPIRLARAYSTSKLLCIMMAMEIAERYPYLNAISFDPGYLPDTKLTREYPAFITALVKPLIPRLMRNDRSSSVAATAPVYARVLRGELSPDKNGGYIVMRSGKGIEVLPTWGQDTARPTDPTPFSDGPKSERPKPRKKRVCQHYPQIRTWFYASDNHHLFHSSRLLLSWENIEDPKPNGLSLARSIASSTEATLNMSATGPKISS